MTTDTVAAIQPEGAQHAQRLTEYRESDVGHAACGEAAIADLWDVDFNNLTGQVEFITNEEARARFGPFWDRPAASLRALLLRTSIDLHNKRVLAS
jgi:hypothetical protein